MTRISIPIQMRPETFWIYVVNIWIFGLNIAPVFPPRIVAMTFELHAYLGPCKPAFADESDEPPFFFRCPAVIMWFRFEPWMKTCQRFYLRGERLKFNRHLLSGLGRTGPGVLLLSSSPIGSLLLRYADNASELLER